MTTPSQPIAVDFQNMTTVATQLTDVVGGIQAQRKAFQGMYNDAVAAASENVRTPGQVSGIYSSAMTALTGAMKHIEEQLGHLEATVAGTAKLLTDKAAQFEQTARDGATAITNLK